MAITEITISNSALIKLGAETITTFDDDNKRARLCKNQYPVLRDKLLRSHPWNFNTKRVELGLLASTPEFEFTYQFQLPNDCLRVLSTNLLSGSIWVIEGDKLKTDSDSVKIKYLASITDTSKFDDNFAEALAWSLAEDLAYSITQSTTRVQQIQEQKRRALANARTFDAQEGYPPQIEADEWFLSRV